jgi:uncharacterized protein YndB with AHSA1/START domain
MIDIASQLEAIARSVDKKKSDSGELVSVQMTRRYQAAIDDVWSALTDPARVERWFYPLKGDLHAGGSFQLEGNAGGDILECDPPRLLKVTFGGPTSLVQLRLSQDGDAETLLDLEHTVPIEMAQSGAGALYVGPGWDGAFMALDLFLHGVVADDPIAAASSPEAVEFSKRSIQSWSAAIESSGTATSDEIAAATEASLAQFAPGDSEHGA